MHGPSGSVGIFADWFRYQLLYEQGGIWADTDVVCLKPLRYPQRELFGRQDEQTSTTRCWRCPQGMSWRRGWSRAARAQPHAARTIHGARAGASSMRRLLPGKPARQRRLGRVSGRRVLPQAARHLGYDDQALPYWHFYPVHYLNWHTVFDSSLRDNPGVIAASTTLHLWNEMTRRAHSFDVNGKFPDDSLFEQLCARYLKTDS